MLTLILAGLRHRVAALTAVAVAAALGSALLLLCGAMFETGIRLSAPPERVSGAEVIVIGDSNYTMLNSASEPTTDRRPFPELHRLPESVLPRVEAIAGVAHAVPISFYEVFAESPRQALTLTGQNAASVVVSGLDAPSGMKVRPGQVVLTTSAAQALEVVTGDSLDLTVAGQSTSVRVANVFAGASDPPTIFLSDVPGETTLDAVGVLVEPGFTERAVQESLGGGLADVTVLTGDERGAAEDPRVSASRVPTIVIGAVFGGIVLTVLATVASGIVALSVRQRSREISLLRATGATGRQAHALLVREATLAGIVGAMTGLLLGLPLAHVLFSAMRAGGVVPSGLRLQAGPFPFAIAAATSAAVVWLAARSAARPARRTRALDALREADLPASRLGIVRGLLGILFGLGAIALAVITCLMPPRLLSATAGPAVLAGATSAALLAPAYLRLALILLRPFLGGSEGQGLRALARSNIRARLGSMATVAGAAALVVGIGAGNLISQNMITATAARAQVATITAQAVVSGPAGAVNSSADALAALPEVEAISSFVSSGGWIEQPYDSSHPDRPWPLRGITGEQATHVLGHQIIDGDLEDLTGASIAVPKLTSDSLGISVGDTVRLRFGDNAVADLRVVATYEDLPGYEQLTLPSDLLAEHTTARTPTTLLVASSGDVSDRDLVQSLRNTLSDEPALAVGDRSALEAALQGGLNVNALINTLMLIVVLAYAMISVVNTVAVSTLGRRRELALLTLAGATRKQVRNLLLLEVTVVAATGLVSGLVVACAAILPTVVVVGGDPLALANLAVVLLVGVAVAAITLPITVIAGRRALFGRPAETVAQAV